jgi:hypothetical protein
VLVTCDLFINDFSSVSEMNMVSSPSSPSWFVKLPLGGNSVIGWHIFTARYWQPLQRSTSSHSNRHGKHSNPRGVINVQGLPIPGSENGGSPPPNGQLREPKWTCQNGESLCFNPLAVVREHNLESFRPHPSNKGGKVISLLLKCCHL